MNKDKLVIDIETKNTFADVGGRDQVEKLDASVVGLYSYNRDQYLHFKEGEFGQLVPYLQNAALVIGFGINRFDLPVLKKYFDLNVMALPRLDLLEEIELAYGSRISLDLLAKHNLETRKTAHGLEAVKFYQEGRWEELISYCLQDVKITKELYDLAKEQKFLLIPKKDSDEIIKVALNLPELILHNSLF